MKVTVNKEHGFVEIIKEKGDPTFHSTEWALAESTFLYHVKKELQKQGYDCIKKRMWKDGHMVDERMQYIRDRNLNYHWYIYNGNWMIYDAGERFNEDGNVTLAYAEFEDD